MSDANHTPGPWMVDQKAQLRVKNSGDITIASCGCSDSERDRWEANAVLIAAAPDLLSALQRLSDQAGRLRFLGQSMSDAEKAAVAAIKKATGEGS